METIIEDRDIIRKVLDGDREAYAELVRRHHPRMIRLCGALLSDFVLAEDAAQEVFLKAYRNLKHYRGDASFATWIYRIACHHCADLLRSYGRRPIESLPEDFPDPSPRSNASLESGELLQKILGGLSEEARNVLVLREVEGLTYEETANVLGCSLDAVKSRLRRARESALEIAKKRGLYAYK